MKSDLKFTSSSTSYFFLSFSICSLVLMRNLPMLSLSETTILQSINPLKPLPATSNALWMQQSSMMCRRLASTCNNNKLRIRRQLCITKIKIIDVIQFATNPPKKSMETERGTHRCGSDLQKEKW